MLDTLGQVLPRAAKKYGHKAALAVGDRSFSFIELNELSNRLANGLQKLGVTAGDRVTLYSQNGWQWIVSYYAIAKLGAVINPINVMLTPEEVLYVVKDCGAKAILASSDKGQALMTIKGASPLQDIILFGDETLAGAISFNMLLEENQSEFEDVSFDPHRLSTIGYTSGTTGHPKGAMLTHRSVLLNSAMTATMHVRTSVDTVVTALPCAHVYGNVVMNGAFLCGMTLVLLQRFNEAEVLQAIQTHRATMVEGVPTMYLYLLTYPDLDKYDLSSLTRCTVGGQTMPVAKMEDVERRFGCPLLELWGMTEIGGLGTTHPFYGPHRLGSIGIPLPYVECRIVDPSDAGKVLGPDEIGELMIRGPIVMQGYYGNEAATRSTIEPDGWLHTGDLARLDAEGYIYIIDRKKDMIITAGYNVYPAEIERVIAAHPAVAMVAVGSQPDDLKGEIAKAYIVLKGGAQADEESILAFCREHLAAYKVPRTVQFVADLPKTSTGKIMRRLLRTLNKEPVRGNHSESAPQTKLSDIDQNFLLLS
ncbi:MAG: long-chain-fatty-acid--CoA ligase [Acidobacteria bacterium]|nr:long-chain-fatty-acid--CoA ligase [Acidobacteriota bacterium]